MKIIVNNLVAEYEDQGQGPVILMLHGWSRNISDFDDITEKLKERFRIIRLDLPGFGGTAMPKEVWDVNAYVNFVRDFIEKINIKPDILLGHSFGGRIIIKGVGDEIFDIKKIILISAAGVKINSSRKNVFKILAKIGDLISYIPPLIFIRRRLKNKFYNIIGSGYLESGKMREVFKVVVEEDLKEWAKKINIPTLLIWGEDDRQTPLADGKLLHSFIQNSKLETISDTGHFVHIEKPEEVVNLINRFV